MGERREYKALGSSAAGRRVSQVCQGRGKTRENKATVSLDWRDGEGENCCEKWRGRWLDSTNGMPSETPLEKRHWSNATENLNCFSMILDGWDGVSYECELSRGRHESGPDLWRSQTRTTSRSRIGPSPHSQTRQQLFYVIFGIIFEFVTCLVSCSCSY